LKQTKLQIIAKTDVGVVRTVNQDTFIVSQSLNSENWILDVNPFEPAADGCIFVVADGMGGTNAGEVASELTIKTVKSYCQNHLNEHTKDDDITHILSDALMSAHGVVKNHAILHPETQGMGTTCSICFIKENNLYITWIGDSRVYRYSPDGRLTNHNFAVEELEQITDDHSLVWREVLAGRMTPEQARVDPQSNIITQSIGDPFSDPTPSSAIYPIYKNDIIINCSDGLNGMLSDEQILAIVKNLKSKPQELIETLISEANVAGGTDNITIAMCQVLEGPAFVAPFIEKDKIDENSNVITTDLLEPKPKKKGSIFTTLLMAVLGLGIVGGIYYYYKSNSKQYTENVIIGTPLESETMMGIDSIVSDTMALEIKEEEKTSAEPKQKPKKEKKTDIKNTNSKNSNKTNYLNKSKETNKPSSNNNIELQKQIKSAPITSTNKTNINQNVIQKTNQDKIENPSQTVNNAQKQSLSDYDKKWDSIQKTCNHLYVKWKADQSNIENPENFFKRYESVMKGVESANNVEGVYIQKFKSDILILEDLHFKICYKKQ